MEGEVENTVLSYIVRDHDREKFEARKQALLNYAAQLNEKYGEGTVTVELKDQYYNMRQQVEPLMHIIDIAFAAMQEAGVTPKVKAIRGGTDGAQLSFKGLPCPNIFAGGLNFHGRYEFVPVQSIEKAMNVVVKIAELTAKIEGVEGTAGIGHTRWATHGKPTEDNAHPHRSETERFVLVHNGVIENYLEIKEEYLSGHHFKGQTDTEIAVHLIGKFVEEDGLSTLEAFKKALHIIRGSYAFALMDSEDASTIYVAKNKSPL